MKFTYIDTPKTTKHKVKAFVKQFMATGEWNKWVVVHTTKGKTPTELANTRQRVYGYRGSYMALQWEVHHGEDNYSIICRKEQIS
jgi:hypothetical protein